MNPRDANAYGHHRIGPAESSDALFLKLGSMAFKMDQKAFRRFHNFNFEAVLAARFAAAKRTRNTQASDAVSLFWKDPL